MFLCPFPASIFRVSKLYALFQNNFHEIWAGSGSAEFHTVLPGDGCTIMLYTQEDIAHLHYLFLTFSDRYS